MPTQLFTPLPCDRSDSALCCYANFSSQVQIARISTVPNWYFERVVFPGQRLLFEAPTVAQLEIHTGAMATAVLSDRIPCHTLKVQDEVST